jgi:uncharacterized protein YjiS (DUF1127 family)
MQHTDIDFQKLDYHRLGQAQRAAVMHHALRRARIERSLALWAMAAGLVALLRRAAAAALDWPLTLKLRRRRRRIVSELHKLDDRMLRDIGVRRCEIVSLATLGDNDDTRLPRSAARRAA